MPPPILAYQGAPQTTGTAFRQAQQQPEPSDHPRPGTLGLKAPQVPSDPFVSKKNGNTVQNLQNLRAPLAPMRAAGKA